MAAKTQRDGILRETGDRWKLDTLIPERERILTPVQVERTSKPRVATKPVLVRGIHNIERARYCPVESHTETIMEKMRREYRGDEPLPGDRLL